MATRRQPTEREVVQILADLADRRGIWAEDVIDYPELRSELKRFRVKRSQVNSHTTSKANRLNSQLVREMEERFNHNLDEAQRRATAKRDSSESEKAMEIKRDDAVQMLTDMGIKGAAKWTTQRLQRRLSELDTVVDSDTEFASAESDELCDKVLEAIEDEQAIVILDGKASKPAKGKGKPAKGKRAAKKVEFADEVEDDEQDDEEEELDDEEEEEEKPRRGKRKAAKGKPAKGSKRATKKAAKAADDKPAKKGAKKKAKGVIATIAQIVGKATKTKPVGKDDILEVLVKEFPDRDPESMAKTINVQVPTRLTKEKDMDIVHTDKGYYTRK